MKPPKAFKHEFVEFIPDTIEEGKIYLSIDRLRDGDSQVRLRLRQGSGDAAEPHGLEAHFRRQDGLSRSVDWQLGLSVPVALLGQE